MRLPVPTPTEFSALAQREIVVNAARIAYTEAGEGPTVLLLHGAVFAGNVVWWETKQALAPHLHTIAPDFLGWGASDKPSAASSRAFSTRWESSAWRTHLSAFMLAA